MTETESKLPQMESGSSWSTLLMVGAVVVVAAILLRTMIRSPSPSATEHPAVGRQLTALDLQPLTGDPPSRTLADLQGKVALVNYWGTWCPPCRMEFPHLVALRSELQDEPQFEMLLVSCGAPDAAELAAATEKYLKQEQASDVPTYHDVDESSRRQLARDAEIDMAYPTTVLLDGQGVIRGLWQGYYPGTEEEMERLIRRLLSS